MWRTSIYIYIKLYVCVCVCVLTNFSPLGQSLTTFSPLGQSLTAFSPLGQSLTAFSPLGRPLFDRCRHKRCRKPLKGYDWLRFAGTYRPRHHTPCHTTEGLCWLRCAGTYRPRHVKISVWSRVAARFSRFKCNLSSSIRLDPTSAGLEASSMRVLQ